MLLLALGIAQTANAQMNNMSNSSMSASSWKIGIGVEPGIATGNAFGSTSFALAGSLRIQYNPGGIVSLMVTSGYDNFFKSQTGGTTTKFGSTTYATTPHDQGLIPVKAGLKVFFVHHVYISGEAGVGFETQFAENKKLLLEPGLGYTMGPWDVSAVYENFSGQSNNYGLAGLRFAYAFGL